MSTAKQIMDKAAALSKGDKPSEPKQKPKRKGAWSQLEEGQFFDKQSGIGVIVSERVRGKYALSFQIVHEDSHGINKFIPYPCKDAPRPLKEVIYLLVERACAFMDARNPKPAWKGKDGGYSEGRRPSRRSREGKRDDRGATGLSQLAKADAQKKGKGSEFVGKTAKKKSKRKA